MKFSSARSLVVAAHLACALSWAASASAQSAAPTTTPSDAPPAPPPRKALGVWLDVAQSGLDASRVRSAIARELGVEIDVATSPNAPLRIAVSNDRHAQVMFRTESGEELSRNVDLPQDPERQEEVIALMVGNLSRNEAAELLAALQPAPSTPPPKPAEPPPAPPPKAKPKPAAPPEKKPDRRLGSGYLYSSQPGANAALFHPLSLLKDSDRRVLAIEASLGYSRVGAIQGIGLSLGGVRVEHQVQGVVLGLGMTQVLGPVRGGQVSVLYNETRGEQVGFDLSGVLLYQAAPLTGASLAGIGSISDDVDGIAVSGLFGYGRKLSGGRIAGLATIASEDVSGVQVAGLFTRSKGLRGVAVSGLLNLTGDMDGVALSLVNVGGRVRGTQIGFVNVATRVDGVQVGLVNYSRDNGDTQLIAYGSNVTPINVGVKFTTGYGYSEFGVGGDVASREGQVFAGAGVHVPLGRLAIDAGGQISTAEDDKAATKSPVHTDVHYLGRLNLELVRGMTLFGGAGARHIVIGTGSGRAEPEFMAGVALF
ncbi:MAG: hypothetical protein QM756_37380 [Polyangiaceae bacterium]